VSWYDKSWSRRAAVTVDNTGAAATVDVEFTVPTDWDDFWDNVIAANGNDIRMVASDGRTLLNYNFTGWSQANRTATIQVDALALSATAGMYLIWLYWGNASAASATVAVAITSPVAAYVDLGVPSQHRLRAVPERAFAARPRNSIAKTTTEEMYVWWDVDDLLEKRRTKTNGSLRLEEPYSVGHKITTGGTEDTTMKSTTAQRFVEHRRRMWVKALTKGGTDGTDYTDELTITTRLVQGTNYRILNPRALLTVRNVDEA